MGWQVTAKTIRCDLAGGVLTTLMVYPDGSGKCTYYNKNSSAKDKAKRLKNCKGLECSHIKEFSQWALTH